MISTNATASSSLPSGTSGTSGRSDSMVLHGKKMLLFTEHIEQALADEAMDGVSRMALLKEDASSMKLKLSEKDIIQLIWKTRRKSDQRSMPMFGGCLIDAQPPQWLLEDIILKGQINLIVAMPKTGKTRLVLAFLAALARTSDISLPQGATEFLGRSISGPCPQVLIIGNDMTEYEWATIFHDYGLVSSGNTLSNCISAVYHAGQPEYLDDDGIASITRWAKHNVGGILVIDSLARVMECLGTSENDAEFATPIASLKQALSFYGITIILIHHTNKMMGNARGSVASRGTSALPALCSQIIYLRHADELNSDDDCATSKILLSTEGRMSKSIELMLEMMEDKQWQMQSLAAFKAAKWHQDIINALSHRQQEAYSHLQAAGTAALSAKALARLMDLDGGDSERKARAVLEQLISLKLANKMQVTISAQGGRGQVYFIAELDLSSIVPTVEHRSEVPEVAEVPEALSGDNGADTLLLERSADFNADEDDDCPF